MKEKSLHAALKKWYAEPGDAFEVRLDGFIIDIVRGDLLIEIQSRNFSALKRKLTKLTEERTVRLVYPIPREKWLVKVEADECTPLGRRKSPKRGSVYHVFQELVRIPHLVPRPNFSLEVLLTREEELRHHTGPRKYRDKGWRLVDRKLLDIVERHTFNGPADFAALLPDGLPDPFTTRDLAEGISHPIRLARAMAFCLRAMGAIENVGKRGNAFLHARAI